MSEQLYPSTSSNVRLTVETDPEATRVTFRTRYQADAMASGLGPRQVAGLVNQLVRWLTDRVMENE